MHPDYTRTSRRSVRAAAWRWSAPRRSTCATTGSTSAPCRGRQAGAEGDAALQDLPSRHRRADQEVRSRARAAVSPVRHQPGHGVLPAHPSGASRPTARGSIDVTLPKAGYYKVLSDFLPSGGASQFIARPLVTAGYAGDLAADSAHLVPDTVLTKTVDDITATLSLDPPTFVVGPVRPSQFSPDRHGAPAVRSPTCRPISARSATRSS